MNEQICYTITDTAGNIYLVEGTDTSACTTQLIFTPSH